MSAPASWTDAITKLSRRLDTAFGEVGRMLELPDRTLQFRPADNAWTIVEIAEHVTLTNHYLLILVDKIAGKARSRSARSSAGPPPLSRFDHLERLAGPDVAWESPEHMRPTGSCGVGEIRKRLAGQRERSQSLLREFPCGEGTLHSIRMSVVGPGERLGLYQFVHFIALHAERHAGQMQRNRRAATHEGIQP